MTNIQAQNDWAEKISTHFTHRELILILVLAAIAFMTTSFGLNHILPGGSAAGFVHGFLNLPGPGAGVFISSAFACLWLVLGLLIVRKTGTAILISAVTMLMGLCMVLAHVGTVRIDYLAIMVAIIIECAGMLPLEQKPWRFVFPALAAVFGGITLVLMLTGNARMGEDGAIATVFPLGYAVSAILALGLAIILWFYPSAKYIIGAGCAEVFYIVFCWLYNGKGGFGSWVPVVPAIPALLSFAFVCGAVMAVIAYGANLLWNMYGTKGTTPSQNRL
jgi:hypothetical protein